MFNYQKVKLVGITQPVTSHPTNTPEELISYCARVSNPANQESFSTSKGLLNYCLKHKHFSIFEMVNAVVEIETTRDIGRQILRHRSFAFQEFCITGESKISLIQPCGRVVTKTIENLYKLQNDPRFTSLVRVYDESSKLLIGAKIKEVFKTGVKPVYKVTLQNGKTITATKDHKFFSKGGFKRLEDLRVGDSVGVNGQPCYKSLDWLSSAKRACIAEYSITLKWSMIKSIEYAGEQETYDMEINHPSHNYVANGIITHNSQRYAIPEYNEELLREARLQDIVNRQNSLETDDSDLAGEWERIQEVVKRVTHEGYKMALEKGIAKEQARAILPEGLTMSRMYMNGTIRSWLHYIDLRSANGTQKEHIDIANKVSVVLEPYLPNIITPKGVWK